MNRVAGNQRRKTLPHSVTLLPRPARACRSMSHIPAVVNPLISLSASELISKSPACVQININHDEGVCNVLCSWKPKRWITLKKSLSGRTRCIPSLQSASSIRAPTSVRSTRASAPSSECTTTCQVTGLTGLRIKVTVTFVSSYCGLCVVSWYVWTFSCQIDEMRFDLPKRCGSSIFRHYAKKDHWPLMVWWCHHDADNIYVQCKQSSKLACHPASCSMMVKEKRKTHGFSCLVPSFWSFSCTLTIFVQKKKKNLKIL